MINSLSQVRENWGDMLVILRNNLPTNDYKHLVSDPEVENGWKFEDAGRPMIEDIICALTEEADRFWEYLKRAGFEVGTLAPRVIHVQAFSRTGMAIDAQVENQ